MFRNFVYQLPARGETSQCQPLRLNPARRYPCIASDPLFFHKPESVTVSAQARQYAHSRITTVEVPMGKLALFLGGFLLLTILIGILGTIPPS
ncbi:hypothetical protein NPS42_13355 [Pseudomonas putida]|uniref:hypothetical protein n=1 Tax=Pseudomonas putida TaxID=303 RepID=UPI0023636D71|nr:hypothetical protein [Pseudomonas putida]MDD2026782.1 hypothetical protein [Pseudomonas putida]HDS1767871.1 hypothetical protein [Pseudomonas putida]